MFKLCSFLTTSSVSSQSQRRQNRFKYETLSGREIAVLYNCILKLYFLQCDFFVTNSRKPFWANFNWFNWCKCRAVQWCVTQFIYCISWGAVLWSLHKRLPMWTSGDRCNSGNICKIVTLGKTTNLCENFFVRKHGRLWFELKYVISWGKGQVKLDGLSGLTEENDLLNFEYVACMRFW